MPLNLPTVTTDDISFGPGRLFIGPAGATPTADIGSISEDGIAFELTSEKRKIMQGNPKSTKLIFTQQESCFIRASSIEWNFDNLKYGLGAGNTTASASEETFAWGGDPFVNEVALHIEHQMPVTGNTLNVYVWKASAEAGFSFQFGHDEHKFDYSWEAISSTTNWAGSTLDQKEQMFKIERVL